MLSPPPKPGETASFPPLRARRLGLHTHREAVALTRTDCPISRLEGLRPHSQVLVSARGRQVRATLFQIEEPVMGIHEVALSESAWEWLELDGGDDVTITHAPPLESLAYVRHRIHGNRLDAAAMNSIVGDVAAGNYADVHLSAFLTATSALPLDLEETYLLTRAMVDCGETLRWSGKIIVDKHSVGGLPGNRTTPIIVAIVTACGLTMPKTSSRAITSPAGTADTMEMITPVDLDLDSIRDVVAKEGGCLAWGGAVRLSPADDIFIGVERMLDVDTEGQLIASVLSKKIAAGATHVVIDIPVGPTAKVRSQAAGEEVAARLTSIAARLGLKLSTLLTDGMQPVGRGVGPSLEAIDVLAVLRSAADAPADLRKRACQLAGHLLEMGGAARKNGGFKLAEETIASGAALQKFERICRAQGGFREPRLAALRHPLEAVQNGRIIHIDNRKIAQLAKLAGAPDVGTAGLRLHVRLGDEVITGQPLVTVYAEEPGDLAYALSYAASNPDMMEIG